MLFLPDVTLVAAHTICHDLAIMAVEDCVSRASFSAVKVFTDRPRAGSADVRIPTYDHSDLGRFITYDVPRHVETSHALYVQWDSWVINPGAWQDSFLDYDYVGAPWWYRDGLNVGNSGFCLRSKRLIDFLASHEDEFPIGVPEDHVLCREYQKRLPQFRWAPEDLAWRFSFERTARYPPGEVFGFHGVFNFPHVLTDGEIEARLAGAPDYVTSKSEYMEMRRLMASRSRR